MNGAQLLHKHRRQGKPLSICTHACSATYWNPAGTPPYHDTGAHTDAPPRHAPHTTTTCTTTAYVCTRIPARADSCGRCSAPWCPVRLVEKPLDPSVANHMSCLGGTGAFDPADQHCELVKDHYCGGMPSSRLDDHEVSNPMDCVESCWKRAGCKCVTLHAAKPDGEKKCMLHKSDSHTKSATSIFGTLVPGQDWLTSLIGKHSAITMQECPPPVHPGGRLAPCQRVSVAAPVWKMEGCALSVVGVTVLC